jgi:hypothetical protein
MASNGLVIIQMKTLKDELTIRIEFNNCVYILFLIYLEFYMILPFCKHIF